MRQAARCAASQVDGYARGTNEVPKRSGVSLHRATSYQVYSAVNAEKNDRCSVKVVLIAVKKGSPSIRNRGAGINQLPQVPTASIASSQLIIVSAYRLGHEGEVGSRVTGSALGRDVEGGTTYAGFGLE
jgi:hypothetical protein